MITVYSVHNTMADVVYVRMDIEQQLVFVLSVLMMDVENVKKIMLLAINALQDINLRMGSASKKKIKICDVLQIDSDILSSYDKY